MNSLQRSKLPFTLLPPSVRGELEDYFRLYRTPRSPFVRAILENNLFRAVTHGTPNERAELLSTMLWFKAHAPDFPYPLPSSANPKFSTVHMELEIDTPGGHYIVPIRLTGQYERRVTGSQDEQPESPMLDLRVIEWKLPGTSNYTPIPEGFLPDRVLGGLCDAAGSILENQDLEGRTE